MTSALVGGTSVPKKLECESERGRGPEFLIFCGRHLRMAPNG